jgi:hypothetical protein
VLDEVTLGHFEELRKHWDEGEIIEIRAVVGLFGFLNRWNDSMANDLDDVPMEFASRTFGAGWGGPGKHLAPRTPHRPHANPHAIFAARKQFGGSL